jgi:stage V sporulation protein S
MARPRGIFGRRSRGVAHMDVLRVSAKSSPNAVAGAIAGVLREQGGVCVQVIGAGALNQAVKAIAIARSFVEPEGIDAICYPEFHDVAIDGVDRTALRLVVEPRTLRTVALDTSASPVTA